MIGWSRRDSESRRRRAAWLSTLTPEERDEEARYQCYVGRRMLVAGPSCFALFLAVAALMYVLGLRRASLAFEAASLPAALVIPFFLFIRTKRRWGDRQ